VLSGGYKFSVGSSVNIFRTIDGHGRRVPRQPLRSIQGTSHHRVLTRPSNSGRTTSAVNAVGQRSAYQVYCSICRRYVPEDLHPRCHDATNNRDRSSTNTTAPNTDVTIAAPVMAQQSHLRSQSNTVSTSVTVNGNNNSTVVGYKFSALHKSLSSNATEGEEDTTIYRRCYDSI
jgi:hypothetical protein